MISCVHVTHPKKSDVTDGSIPSCLSHKIIEQRSQLIFHPKASNKVNKKSINKMGIRLGNPLIIQTIPRQSVEYFLVCNSSSHFFSFLFFLIFLYFYSTFYFWFLLFPSNRLLTFQSLRAFIVWIIIGMSKA